MERATLAPHKTKLNRVQSIISWFLSGMGVLCLVHLYWQFKRYRKGGHGLLRDSADGSGEECEREHVVEEIESNIIWQVMRPVITPILASSLQDRTTQNAFRSLCRSVLSDDAVKNQFREVVGDVFHSNAVQESFLASIVAIISFPKVGHALGTLFQNTFVDDQATTGFAKVLAKTLNIDKTDE